MLSILLMSIDLKNAMMNYQYYLQYKITLFIQEQKLDKVPVLIFANKQDIETSLPGDEVNKNSNFRLSK